MHNLLDLSRIRAGGVQIKPARVDAGEVVRACEKIERVGAAEHGHELTVEVAPALPPVRADHSALRRALCTVVENAIKYTPAGGSIALRARRDESGGVAVEVEDDGGGIHPEDLPHVFDSFYRGRQAGAASPDVPEQEVPGIGLHLARVLVEGMNGTIEARSRLGQGSTFTLRLPAWRVGEIAEGDESSAIFANKSGHHLTSDVGASRGV